MEATIELDLLNLFVAVAEASSFSGAAQKLGVPKSTVSRGVARLEERLGAQLFQRTTRHVSLSTAGQALFERVAPLLGSLREAVSALPEREDVPSGVLRLTAPYDMGATLVAEWVARFVARYPQVRVDARITNRQVDLVAEGFDLALRAAGKPLKDSSLIAKRLACFEFGVYAHPSYLARRGTPRSAAELVGHEWVAFRAWTSLPGLPPMNEGARVVADDFSFVREAIRLGAGIGALPTFLAQEDVAAGRLTRVLPRYVQPGAQFVMLYPRTKQLPRKVAAFRDFIVEALATRPISPKAA